MQDMSRVRLDRVHLVAAFSDHWRTESRVVEWIEEARDAGFGWVLFDWAEQPPGVPSRKPDGWVHRFVALARRLGISIGIAPQDRYSVSEAAAIAGLIRVPAARVFDVQYWIALSQARGFPVVLYDTPRPNLVATTGRIPIFIPSANSCDCDMDAYFGANRNGAKSGVALDGDCEDDFMRAVLLGAPFVILTVGDGRQDHTVPISAAARWIKELKDADAALDGQPKS